MLASSQLYVEGGLINWLIGLFKKHTRNLFLVPFCLLKICQQESVQAAA